MVDQMGHALVQDVPGPLGSQVLDINLVVVMGIYPATPEKPPLKEGSRILT